MKYVYLLTVLFVLLKTNETKAQCNPIIVNLTGMPEGTWVSPPGTVRDQNVAEIINLIVRNF